MRKIMILLAIIVVGMLIPVGFSTNDSQVVITYGETTYNNANYKYSNPNFNGLIKDKSALPIIQRMSESDKLEFKRIEKRLSKTKFWDIKISSIGNAFEEFKFSFINKKNGNGVITDGIYPYKQCGNTISFYSIVYGPENTSLNTLETLSFKSKKRAAELYDKYRQNVLYTRNRGYNITPLESLKIKEVELSMLEEAFETKNGKHNISHVVTGYQTKQTTGNDLFEEGHNNNIIELKE